MIYMKTEIPEEIKNNFNKWKTITGIDNINEYFQDALFSISSDLIYREFIEDDEVYFIKDNENYDWIFYINRVGFDNRFGNRFKFFITDVERLYDNRKRFT